MKTVKISILNNFKGYKYKYKKNIKSLFNKVLDEPSIKGLLDSKLLNAKRFLFDIVFTSDKDIQEINRDYRNIDKPTDVITFSLFTDDENSFVLNNEINLGEIIISIDTAKKQAKVSLDYEVDLLILHGILHLLGFDHQTEKDYNFIVSVQNKIMKEIYNA